MCWQQLLEIVQLKRFLKSDKWPCCFKNKFCSYSGIWPVKRTLNDQVAFATI